MCVLYQCTHFICIDIPYVTACYGTSFVFVAFFWVFSYFIDDHSCLNCCVFTKLSQIMSLINVQIQILSHSIQSFFWRYTHHLAYIYTTPDPNIFEHKYIFIKSRHVIYFDILFNIPLMFPITDFNKICFTNFFCGMLCVSHKARV